MPNMIAVFSLVLAIGSVTLAWEAVELTLEYLLHLSVRDPGSATYLGATILAASEPRKHFVHPPSLTGDDYAV